MIVGTKTCNWNMTARYRNLFGRRDRAGRTESFYTDSGKITEIPIIRGSVTFYDAKGLESFRFHDGHDDWWFETQSRFAHLVLVAISDPKGEYTLRGGSVHGLWGFKKSGQRLLLTFPDRIPGSNGWEPCKPYREDLVTFFTDRGLTFC